MGIYVSIKKAFVWIIRNGAFLVALSYVTYFLVFGLIFVIQPSNIVEFANVTWVEGFNSGITEIRVYYGALSLGLGVYFLWLIKQKLITQCLTGGSIISGFVVTFRIIGTIIDNAYGEAYTTLAIGFEIFFFVGLTTILIFEKNGINEKLALFFEQKFKIEPKGTKLFE